MGGRTGDPQSDGPCLWCWFYFAVNTAVTCTTGWAGVPGFTPVSLRHMGYYDHRRKCWTEGPERGSLTLSCMFTPRSRVLAFGEASQGPGSAVQRPELLRCNRKRRNVYLVKRLAYFEEFLRYAGTDVFLRGSRIPGRTGQGLQMIEDMIAEEAFLIFTMNGEI